jgi:D-proline reductase (dithiol) PrdB
VGLVQREIEAAGIATLALSTIAELTAAAGAPRVAAIEYPPGRPFGRPGDAAGQADVLRAALEALEALERPGAVVDLPFEWPEPRSKVRYGAAEPPPITRLIKRKPWLWGKLLSREIPPD